MKNKKNGPFKWRGVWLRLTYPAAQQCRNIRSLNNALLRAQYLSFYLRSRIQSSLLSLSYRAAFLLALLLYRMLKKKKPRDSPVRHHENWNRMNSSPRGSQKFRYGLREESLNNFWTLPYPTLALLLVLSFFIFIYMYLVIPNKYRMLVSLLPQNPPLLHGYFPHNHPSPPLPLPLTLFFILNIYIYTSMIMSQKRQQVDAKTSDDKRQKVPSLKKYTLLSFLPFHLLFFFYSNFFPRISSSIYLSFMLLIVHWKNVFRLWAWVGLHVVVPCS